MKRADLVLNLERLGYALVKPKTHKVKNHQVLELLDELIDSEDPRLVEGFPVVLANCTYEGLNLDFKSLLSKHKPGSRKKQDLEKLVLISSDLLTQQGLDKPKNLEGVLTSLKAKYGDLLANDAVILGNKVSLSTERLRNTFKRYTSDIVVARSNRKRDKDIQRRSFQLNYFLGALFAPKQKEIVLKKYNGETLNKTEQEYYSRKVKKKLEAMANSEVKKVIAALTKK